MGEAHDATNNPEKQPLNADKRHGEISTLAEAEASLASAKAALAADILALQKDIQSEIHASDEALGQLEAKLSQSILGQRYIKGESAFFRDKTEKLAGALRSLQDKLAQAHKRIGELMAYQERNERLEREKAALELEIGRWKEESEGKEKSLGQLRVLISSLQTQVDYLKGESESWKAKSAQDAEARTRALEEAAEMEQKLIQARVRTSELQDKLMASERVKAEYEAIKNEMENKVIPFKSLYDAAILDKRRMEEELFKKQQEIERLKDKGR